MEREEEAPAVSALVFPFSTISGNAISLAISTFGGQSVCLFSFSLLVCARPRNFSLCPDKTRRLLHRLQQRKTEPGNSVANCILMSDPLVLFLNKNQRTSYIHKSIISEQDIKNHKFQPRMRIKWEDYQPSCQFSFSSLVLDAILAFGKLQILHFRQLRFPTAPVCQEKKHS